MPVSCIPALSYISAHFTLVLSELWPMYHNLSSSQCAVLPGSLTLQIVLFIVFAHSRGTVIPHLSEQLALTHLNSATDINNPWVGAIINSDLNGGLSPISRRMR
ncbi:hypothetical protein WG66_016446 [Moniliophthora roreri]|nr:hypothetical protein WG66_016446 [Moniliophthora roreri]